MSERGTRDPFLEMAAARMAGIDELVYTMDNFRAVQHSYHRAKLQLAEVWPEDQSLSTRDLLSYAKNRDL